MQTWECVTGSGAMEVEGERRELKAGDRVVLHLNTAHRDPFTGEDEMVIRGIFEPITDFLETFADALAHHSKTGRSTTRTRCLCCRSSDRPRDRRPGPRAGIPVRLQRAGLPLVSRIARLRGYRASYD